MTLAAPFPYFGGKRRAAPLVWRALGDPAGYAVLVETPDTCRKLAAEQLNDNWQTARGIADAIGCTASGTGITGIVTFEEEFLAHLVLPGGQTVGERLGPELDAIDSGDLPPLLPGTTG